MEGGKSHWNSGERRLRKPRKRTLLVAIASVILVAALITVVVLAIHRNNQDNESNPGEIGTIPPPVIWSPPVNPSPYVPPPTIAPSTPPPVMSPPVMSPPMMSPPMKSPPVMSPPISDTIVMACNGSLYRDVCISSLSSYPGASHANMSQLAGIAVELSLDEAKKSYAFVDDLSRNSTNKSEKNALDDCVELLQDTVEQLNNSLSTLTSLSSGSFQDEIGDVQTWVSAALTNPSTCVEGFQEVNANMVPVVKARTENVTEFMSNALAVLSKLAIT